MPRTSNNFLQNWLFSEVRGIFQLACNHPLETGLTILVLISILVLVLQIIIRAKKAKRALSILKSAGVANNETKVDFKKFSISHASISAIDCERRIEFFNEVFRATDIVRVEHKNHTHYFKRAEFPKKLSLPARPTGREIGFDDRGKEALVKTPNFKIQALPGKGKTTLLNYLIACNFKALAKVPAEFVIFDVHDTYQHLKDEDRFTVFNTHAQKSEGIAKIDEALSYQKTINLGRFASLIDMQAAGEGLHYKAYRFVFDEVSLSFSSSSKEEAKLNAELISKLTLLLRSGRKFNQFVWASDQDLKRTSSLLESTAFNCELHSYSEIAASRDGYPTTSELLKTPGTFFLVDRDGANRFIRIPYVSKEILINLIRGKV